MHNNTVHVFQLTGLYVSTVQYLTRLPSVVEADNPTLCEREGQQPSNNTIYNQTNHSVSLATEHQSLVEVEPHHGWSTEPNSLLLCTQLHP